MPILVSDFDGTMTGRDYFGLVIERFDPPAARIAWDDFLAGRANHFEAMARVLASAPVDEAGLLELVAATEPAPGLGPAAQRLQAAGWKLVVASAGCGWYVERILAAHGVRAEIHASPGHPGPDGGLVMLPPRGSPYFCPETGIDKCAVVRAALDRDPVVAFAGDGRPDLAPARLVVPEQRFARGWLAERFLADGQEFMPYAHWPEIVDHLLKGESPPAAQPTGTRT